MAILARVRMLMLAAIACCILMGSASAHENEAQKIMPIDHIVGGGFGWRLPETNKTLYDDWAKPRVFGVGDTLVFPYRSGTGTVVQVDKEDYDNCTQKKVIWVYVQGPTNVTLTKPGDYYFYNGNGKHCEGGQKLHVNAQAGVQGKSGTKFSFKINLSVNRKSSAGSTLKAPAPSPVVAATAPAPAPKASAATSIQNVGIASGIFTILFSLFI